MANVICSCYQLNLAGITLRNYQLTGINWLVERYHARHGCILADEMGLGKTCQTIAFLLYVCAREKKSTHLILCPLSVLTNWKEELERFAPSLKVLSYVGQKESRAALRDILTKKEHDIVLSTFEICLKDEHYVSSVSWHTLTVDEAHRLKNSQSLLYVALRKFSISHHLLLTGTPVQNNLRELYSLLTFVAPNIFSASHLDEFVLRYNDIRNRSDASELHDLLQPLLLRRVKSEVLKDLPERSEVVLFHGLSNLQKQYYKAILTRDLDVFDNPNQTSKTALMNIIMQLRKCVNHPYLFDGVEPEPFELGDHLVKASAKLILLDQLLAFLKQQGHKVLLFSQMTRMLDIIQDYLGYRGYSYERLDGSVRGEERYIAIKNFNEQNDTFMFLLSTKAGGQGLNLVSADTVIFVDSDFNPQNDLQAAARAHRIGQKRCVKVIRLLGRSTVEEMILQRAMSKLLLTDNVIEGGQFSLGATTLTGNASSLKDLVTFGVDQLFTDDSTLETADLVSMLGPSLDGQWQTVNTPQAVKSDETKEEERTMYMFEGRDYSKQSSADKIALQKLLSDERDNRMELASAGRPHREAPPATMLSSPRKPRLPLTAEQLEARRIKREATLSRKAEQAEALAIELANTQKEKREARWQANNYTSYNISRDDESSEEGEEDSEAEEDGDIHYVVGDVTHPQTQDHSDVIIVHCVADCGHWGRGGLFSAISSCSSQPELQYTAAGEVKDLHLGDVHLIPLDHLNSQQQTHSMQTYVALVVAQHRSRQGDLSAIKLNILDEALRTLSKVARRKKASVHLPRIGYNTVAFNWYGTERLIRKHLVNRAVQTYIYYFNRRLPLKRKASSPIPSTSKRVSGVDSEGDTTKESLLPDFMQGVAVYFHNVDTEKERKLTRYLIAFNGDVHKYLEQNTTYILTVVESYGVYDDLQTLSKHASTQVLDVRWLEQCLRKRAKLNSTAFRLNV